jgi:GT2 family glycosyltransferase
MNSNLTETNNYKPKVFISILNWNDVSNTIRCLDHILRQNYENYSIVVVDNGSDDDSYKILKELKQDFHLIRSEINLGYTGGNNIVIDYALNNGADYVWLFNNDAIANQDMLSILVDESEKNLTTGIIGPLVKNAGSEATQFAIGVFDLRTPVYRPIYNIDEATQIIRNGERNIAIVGTAMLIKRAVFEKIGKLDVDIFAYWEDIDFSIRSINAGFENSTNFATSLYHPCKDTKGDPFSVKPNYYYFMTRNEILMWRRYCPRVAYYRSVYWTVKRQIGQINRMPDYHEGVDAVLAGIWDGIIGRGGPYVVPARRPMGFLRIFLNIFKKIQS